MVAHLLVGLTGRKRHGKDSCADVLVKEFGFVRYRFADVLKQVCQLVFQLSHAQVHGDEKEKETVDPRWNTTPRKLMQVVGTEMFRETLLRAIPEIDLGSDGSLWCHSFRMWVESLPTSQRIVISDVRFEDEARIIRSLGGFLFRVVRPHWMAHGDDPHVSETAQDAIPVDDTVVNDADVATLSNKMRDVFMTRLERWLLHSV
jgi:hypothetical protein